MGQLPTFCTTDLALAVFLSFKECKEGAPPWRVVTERGRRMVEFHFMEVDAEYLQQFRQDRDGFRRYNDLRRLFLRIVKDELGRD